ncbi:uncharacterized protein LOC129779194 [Toxorhynchites rutilus septentrionalis]|uniref:uncharacterized protein LOC129779194 n=1 Tax=Toxorhynchites rutilus septentrionalis TaxID=329112 RepID=UPI00247878D7|nr:uncharacterized protein LOC129779194 [Toxorhynchites rutilus septentrionalis]
MGNCLKGVLSEENQARRALSTSDSQYEMLVEGTLQQKVQNKQNKSKGKIKFFGKFWQRKNVEYSRLNKSNNNFIERSNSNNRQGQRPEIQLQCLDAHSLLMVSRDNNTRRSGYHDLNTDVTSTPGSSLDLEWEHDYGYHNNHWPIRPSEDQQQNYPNSDLDPVFKVEEWSGLKKSKDRINSIRRLDRNTSAPTPDGMANHPLASVGPNGSGAIGTPSICGSYASSSHISTPEDSLEWDIDQDRQLKSENESLDLETKELLMEIELLKNRVLNETGASLKDLKGDESIS